MRAFFVLVALSIAACQPRSAVSSSSSPEAMAPLAVSAAPDTSLVDASIDASLDASPPYHLATDLADRAATARRRFPAAEFPAYCTRVEGDVYLLVSPQGPAMLAAGAAQLRRGLRFFYGHSIPSDPSSPPPFAKRPVRAITVYLFATRPRFIDFALREENVDARKLDLYGFYLRTPRDLVVSGQEGMGTMLHEMVHPIVAEPDGDFPDVPLWMDEGLASLFEQAFTDDAGAMHGQSNKRYEILQAALRADAGPPPPGLASLFAMSSREFKGGRPRGPDGGIDEEAKAVAELLHYSASRAFCQWLDSKHHKLWAFMHAWRDGFATDKTGEKAFAATMGGSPDALDDDWRKWVLAQRW